MEWLVILVLFQQAQPANQAAAPPAAAQTAETNKTAPAAGAAAAPGDVVAPIPAAPGDVPSDAWVQEARDWLVAVREAYDNMAPEQTAALRRSFERMPPAALRVLVTVYEHTYGVQSPLSAADRRPPNQTEAEREWIVTYRILYDRLSASEAVAYGEELRKMNPRQIRTLLEVYEEKNRQQQQRLAQQTASPASPGEEREPTQPTSPGQTPTPEEQAAARRAQEIARQQREFQEMSRQLALNRAGIARSDTKQAMLASNTAANESARAAEQRVRSLEAFSDTKALQQSAFQNEMFTRGAYPNSSPGGTFFYRAY